jgi:DNA replication and repair protein RecF
MVVGAEQVVVTAAVADDIPTALSGIRFTVDAGQVRRDS